MRIDQSLDQTFTYGGYQFGVAARSKFWGVGPRAGLAAKWDLGSGVSLNARFAGTLAVGSFERRTEFNVGGPSIVDDAGTTTGINPGVESAVSLGYRFSLGGLDLHASLGYEFSHWFGVRPFRPINFAVPPFFTSSGDSGTSGMGFDGFTFRLKATW